MATAQVNGVEITYTDTGGDRPAVLFNHGFLMDHTMFDAQIDALADEYRCLAWDQRAFGGTRATEPFTYWDSADDAIALLDHLDLDRAVMVGMSQGGFVGLRAALRHPDRVRALMLLDSSADPDDAETLAGYEQMAAAIRHGTDEQREGVFEIVAGLILGDAELARDWVAKWRVMDREELWLAARALLDRDDVSDRIAEITCPIGAIHGGADRAISLDRAQAIESSARDHRGVTVVDGAAHASNMTHPTEVTAAIREFLASL